MGRLMGVRQRRIRANSPCYRGTPPTFTPQFTRVEADKTGKAIAYLRAHSWLAILTTQHWPRTSLVTGCNEWTTPDSA